MIKIFKIFRKRKIKTDETITFEELQELLAQAISDNPRLVKAKYGEPILRELKGPKNFTEVTNFIERAFSNPYSHPDIKPPDPNTTYTDIRHQVYDEKDERHIIDIQQGKLERISEEKQRKTLTRQALIEYKIEPEIYPVI